MNRSKPNFVAKHIEPSGLIVEIRPSNGQKFTLAELQGYVGGYIEAIYPPSRDGNAVLIVNELGKLNHLPLNPVATELWQEECDPGSPRSFDVLVGSVVLLHHSQF